MEQLPPPGVKGTYALVFKLDRPLALEAGRLGRVLLPPGWLVYVGSAFGPGGLRARLARHLCLDKRLHWHVDSLTMAMPAHGWYAEAHGERRECLWVRALLSLPGTSVPVRGFGNGDCRLGCPAHLL